MRLCAVTLLAVALAAPAAADPGSSARKAKDPNEMICEKQQVLGSRLAAKKVCMTRAQWEEQRRADQQLISKSQLGACQRQAGC
jgi:predicted secreted protein